MKINQLIPVHSKILYSGQNRETGFAEMLQRTGFRFWHNLCLFGYLLPGRRRNYGQSHYEERILRLTCFSGINPDPVVGRDPLRLFGKITRTPVCFLENSLCIREYPDVTFLSVRPSCKADLPQQTGKHVPYDNSSEGD